jgi:hypothetical protein
VSILANVLFDAQFASTSVSILYSAPTSPKATRTIIDKFTATNISALAATLQVYLVPSGGTEGSDNQILKDASIAAGATLDASALQNHILKPGDKISVKASAASAINVRASGREII